MNAGKVRDVETRVSTPVPDIPEHEYFPKLCTAYTAKGRRHAACGRVRDIKLLVAGPAERGVFDCVT
jgi:hypothetical protein